MAVCRAVPDRDRDALHTEFRAVRFVYVQAPGPAAASGDVPHAVRIDAGAATADAIQQVRQEFGI